MNIFNMRIIFLILIVFTVFSSCSLNEEKKVNNDFSFYLRDADLYMTTSKREGGDFYVMFSRTDSVSELSDSTDYIHCRVEDANLVIVFDPNNKKDIYLMYPYVEKINKKKLNLIELNPDDFTAKFYHPGLMTYPDTLKNPYKELCIAPMSYGIIYQRDSTFESQIDIREGNIWGE